MMPKNKTLLDTHEAQREAQRKKNSEEILKYKDELAAQRRKKEAEAQAMLDQKAGIEATERSAAWGKEADEQWNRVREQSDRMLNDMAGYENPQSLTNDLVKEVTLLAKALNATMRKDEMHPLQLIGKAIPLSGKLMKEIVKLATGVTLYESLNEEFWRKETLELPCEVKDLVSVKKGVLDFDACDQSPELNPDQKDLIKLLVTASLISQGYRKNDKDEYVDKKDKVLTEDRLRELVGNDERLNKIISTQCNIVCKNKSAPTPGA